MADILDAGADIDHKADKVRHFIAIVQYIFYCNELFL